jgi:hypothetical protein
LAKKIAHDIGLNVKIDEEIVLTQLIDDQHVLVDGLHFCSAVLYPNGDHLPTDSSLIKSVVSALTGLKKASFQDIVQANTVRCTTQKGFDTLCDWADRVVEIYRSHGGDLVFDRTQVRNYSDLRSLGFTGVIDYHCLPSRRQGVAVDASAMTNKGGKRVSGVRIPKRSKVVIVQPAKKKNKTSSNGPQPVVITHRSLFPKGSFARTGGALGSIFGPKGAALGAAAGAALSRITGVGDYKVKQNSVMTDSMSFSGEVPHFGRADNATRVRHREFVTDITVGATPGNFVNTSYVINPGNAALFPWLSKIAENYQQYEMHGCVFVFKSTTSDYSSAGALGKIAMATNYNVRDSAFANMQELENAEFSVSGKPSLSRVHPIECAANNGVPLKKWVRDVQYDASGGDDRLYDVGKFQFATQGLPSSTANATIGELWITYDITLFKPIVGRLPTQVVYNPVTVPVFDQLGGNNSTSVFQLERTELPSSYLTGKTRSEVWDLLHRPDKFIRTSGAVDTDLVSFSNTRVSNPDLSSATFPAVWDRAYDDNTPPNVISTKSELRLKRPGIWYMDLTMELIGTSAISSASPSVNNIAWPVWGAVPNTLDKWKLPGIQVTARNSDGTPNTAANIKIVAGGPGNALTTSTSDDVAFGTYGYLKYREGFSWTLMVHVTPAMVVNGGFVGVRFQTANETSTTVGPAFKFQDLDNFDTSYIRRLKFELGCVNVSSATYYTPAQQGLTRDDKEVLEDSVGNVLALLPKLKALGFEV